MNDPPSRAPLQWHQTENAHEYRAYDDVALYVITNDNCSWSVQYFPSPGPPVTWSCDAASFEEATHQAEACASFLHERGVSSHKPNAVDGRRTLIAGALFVLLGLLAAAYLGLRNGTP